MEYTGGRPSVNTSCCLWGRLFRGTLWVRRIVNPPLLPSFTMWDTVIASVEMHGLGEGAVAGGVPNGEAYPFLARGIERDCELLGAESGQVGGWNHLRVGGIAIAPNQLDELQGEGPFHVGSVGAAGAGAFDAPVAQQDFAAGDEEIPGPHGADDGAPILVEARDAVELDVVDVELGKSLVIGVLHVRVAFRDQVFEIGRASCRAHER